MGGQQKVLRTTRTRTRSLRPDAKADWTLRSPGDRAPRPRPRPSAQNWAPQTVKTLLRRLSAACGRVHHPRQTYEYRDRFARRGGPDETARFVARLRLATAREPMLAPPGRRRRTDERRDRNLPPLLDRAEETPEGRQSERRCGVSLADLSLPHRTTPLLWVWSASSTLRRRSLVCLLALRSGARPRARGSGACCG